MLAKCNICVDIGGGDFDHHQVGFNQTRNNGIKLTETHCFSFISSFLPLWLNNTQDDFNNQFYTALVTTITVLEQELKTTIGREIAKEIITSNWNSLDHFYNGILEIPWQTIDWVETVIYINDSTNSNKYYFLNTFLLYS